MRQIIQTLWGGLCLSGIVYYIYGWTFPSYRNNSEAMVPALAENADIRIRRFGEAAKEGDIVALLLERDRVIFRRVISSGARVYIRDGEFYHESQRLRLGEFHERGGQNEWTEGVGDREWRVRMNASRTLEDQEFIVGSHNLFVLGDSRDRSQDSRHYGVFSQESVLGVVW